MHVSVCVCVRVSAVFVRCCMLSMFAIISIDQQFGSVCLCVSVCLCISVVVLLLFLFHVWKSATCLICLMSLGASHLEDVGRTQRGHELHEGFVRDAVSVLLQRVARGRLHHVQQLLVAQVLSQQLQSPPQIVLGNVVLFIVFNPTKGKKQTNKTKNEQKQISHNF